MANSSLTALRRLCVCVLLVLGLGVTRQAQAQVPDAIYQDVRSVIDDLLTKEVAQSVVPELACRTGRVEVAVTDPSKVPTGLVHIGDKYYQLLALYHFPNSLEDVYSQQFGALRSALVDDSADLAGYLLYEELRYGSKVAAAAAVKVNGAKAAAPPAAPIAATPTAAAEDAAHAQTQSFSTRAKQAHGPNYAPANADDQAACVTQVQDMFAKGDFETNSTSPLDDLCATRVTASDNYRCELAFALRSALRSEPAVAEDHLTRAAGWIAADILSQALKVPVSQEPNLAEIITLALRDAFVKGDPMFITTLSQDLVPLVVGQTAAQIQAALQPFSASLQLLISEWRLGGGVQPVTIRTFIDTIGSASGAIQELCTNSVVQVCEDVHLVQTFLSKNSSIWPLVQAAGAGDVRTAAHLAVSTLFGAIGDVSNSADQANVELYRRFTDSIVMYVIDVAQDKTPTDATQAAFRAAATDVIQALGKNGGVDRNFGLNVLIPDLGLRASWNSGYVNDSGSSFRYVAAINWITLRAQLRYTEYSYAALHFSLFDPIAPLAELATRSKTNVDYDHVDRLTYNAFAPRADLVLGVPALSRHLVVGAGATLRMTAPVRTSTTISGGVTQSDYDYRTVFDKGGDWPRFVEFGFLVKYVL